jgi:hypothetical protein
LLFSCALIHLLSGQTFDSNQSLARLARRLCRPHLGVCRARDSFFKRAQVLAPFLALSISFLLELS